MIKQIKIGYMDSCNRRTMKTLTPEIFESLITSAKVQETMTLIQNETDTEKKAKLKETLPVVFYACQMPENGERVLAKTAIPSGFCMHDWDHIGVDPRVFYFANIAGREKELRIVLAHVTPSGEGLRLVTVLYDCEKIPAVQEKLAARFGMEQCADPKIKDLSRMSFLPSKDYLLYIDNEGLFGRTAEVKEEDCKESEKSTETTVNDCKNENNKQKQTSTNYNMTADNSIADSFEYEGIKFSKIIDALLLRIASQGQPKEGERNDDLYMLVRELRHICKYNFQTVYMLVAPYFSTLDDAEIRRTISSAISSNGRTITPVMQGVLNQLKNENVEITDESDTLTLSKLPKLSAVEEMILAHYPKHLRAQAYMAMLPIWGTYGTHVRFQYMDGRENSLSFMTAVVGKSGSGKAFAAHLYGQMTKRFQNEDFVERQKADEYLAMVNKISDSSDKPDDPRPRVRLYGDDITTSQLLEYLDNLKGEHGLQFTEEVVRLQKAKRTIYGDNDDLYCKAFDNAIGGKESKSKQTRNIKIPIYLNTLFCGTPGAMHKFYNNPEGGLNNRVIFAFMPKVRLKGFPHYEKLSETEQAQLDEACDRLWNYGTDGSMVHLPWLERTILSIKSKCDKEDNENPDDVWYDLGKRAMVIAMRVGVLEWILRGCPDDEKSQRDISKVVKWIAETVQQGVYAFSGKDYEKINENDNAYVYQQQQTRLTKNKKLFSLLGDEFTTQDVISIRVQNGDSTNVSMVLSRWIADGLVKKVADGRYEKRQQLSA